MAYIMNCALIILSIANAKIAAVTTYPIEAGKVWEAE